VSGSVPSDHTVGFTGSPFQHAPPVRWHSLCYIAIYVIFNGIYVGAGGTNPVRLSPLISTRGFRSSDDAWINLRVCV
jgi:hypothetical protein